MIGELLPNACGINGDGLTNQGLKIHMDRSTVVESLSFGGHNVLS
jgi:hypothetical protein